MHVDVIYKEMIDTILNDGDRTHNRTGIDTLSVFGYQARFDLREGFPLLTTKKMFTKAIFWELLWFLQGRTDNKWLNDRKVTIWDEWATEEQCARFGREAGNLGPIYGHQWRNFGATQDKFGTDQIANLFNDLENNPESRRMIVTGWNPAEVTQVALPPCHTLWQVKTSPMEDEEGTLWLDLQLYQRSADLGLGVPFNIASYAAIAHLLCHLSKRRIVPRYFVHTFGDLHIYENHVDALKEQYSRKPFPMPQLMISPYWQGTGMQAINGMEDNVDVPDGTRLAATDFTVVNYQCHDRIKMDVAI